MEKQLIYNSVKCLNCGEVLISHHRHDYKTCSCENKTMVDGGLEYLRFGGKDFSLIETNCLYDDEPFEVIREHVFRGGKGKSGKEELKYVKLSEVDNEWLGDIIDYENCIRPNNKYLKYYNKELEYRTKFNISIQDND